MFNQSFKIEGAFNQCTNISTVYGNFACIAFFTNAYFKAFLYKFPLYKRWKLNYILPTSAKKKEKKHEDGFQLMLPSWILVGYFVYLCVILKISTQASIYFYLLQRILKSSLWYGCAEIENVFFKSSRISSTFLLHKLTFLKHFSKHWSQCYLGLPCYEKLYF